MFLGQVLILAEPIIWSHSGREINCIDDARDDQMVDDRRQNTENPQLANNIVEWSVGQRERANFNGIADGD